MLESGGRRDRHKSRARGETIWRHFLKRCSDSDVSGGFTLFGIGDPSPGHWQSAAHARTSSPVKAAMAFRLWESEMLAIGQAIPDQEYLLPACFHPCACPSFTAERLVPSSVTAQSPIDTVGGD